MLVSMTGYGKSQCLFAGKKITSEIRALNSKQSDINIRIPAYYKEKELVIRDLLIKKLVRGKIELSIYVENSNNSTNTLINKEILLQYYNQLHQIADENSISENSWISTLLKMPDVISTERTELNETEWDKVLTAIYDAIEKLVNFREQDGIAMGKDILSRIYLIQNLLSEIDVFEEERITNIKTRILKNLSELHNRVDYDKNRFEQEMIYYLEKLDITEEKVRLSNHCKYFIENMKSEETVGKKLAFISQEIGREINTLGSKANHADIQRIVIQMKDELEKIKEQLMNIL